MIFRRKKFPLKPGPWYFNYAADYSANFGIPVHQVINHSAVVGATGGYAWATETPEWDRDWFNRRGYDFPARWLPYEILDGYQGVAGEPVRLDV